MTKGYCSRLVEILPRTECYESGLLEALEYSGLLRHQESLTVPFDSQKESTAGHTRKALHVVGKHRTWVKLHRTKSLSRVSARLKWKVVRSEAGPKAL